jgi:hypothetical protein
MIALSQKWAAQLTSQPETGMGYQIVSVILKSGKRFDQVIINSGYITRVRGFKGIPFTEDEIQEIIVTHDGWDFRHE